MRPVSERAEAGFSLLELTVCVGLLIAGCVLALALLPVLARNAQAQTMRAAATGIARNAIERARAATAYYPAAGVSIRTRAAPRPRITPGCSLPQPRTPQRCA